MMGSEFDKPTQENFFPHGNPYEHGSPFKRLPHGPATTALAHAAGKKSRYREDRIARKLTWATEQLEVEIEKCGKPLIDEAQRFLDFLGLYLANSDSPILRVPYSDYYAFRGAEERKDRQRLRKKVAEAAEILLNTHITWRGKKRGITLRANILGSYVGPDESSKYIQVSLTLEYYAYVKNSYDMPFDTRLGRLDSRNPNLYKIARKLNEHYWMRANQEAGTHDRLKVKTLLKAAPDIPTFEEVRDKDRAYRQKIITPLENCLDALVDAGILHQWYWLRADNTELTDEELARADYDTLIECKVVFQYTNPVKKLPSYF